MSKPDEKTHAGYLNRQLLLAMPGMSDPNFIRSVTLLCQHNEEGAIGITINRESGFTLGEMLAQLGIPCQDDAIGARMVLEGGPVGMDRGFVLHSPRAGFESSMEITPEIMVTTSRDVLTAIASGNGPEQYQVALGYAGWGDGQLEYEISQNAWLSVPVDRAILFELPVEQRWQQAYSRLGVDIHHLHDVGGHA